jgi:two-component system, OmpR family, response regulator TctD
MQGRSKLATSVPRPALEDATMWIARKAPPLWVAAISRARERTCDHQDVAGNAIPGDLFSLSLFTYCKMIGDSKMKVLSMKNDATPKPRLLLVEDDPSLAPALALALSRRGFTMAQATDGATALERATKEKFDVIVLDLTLPELDGLDVLQKLRSGGKLTPIVVLTARGTVGDRVQGLKLGADDYLAKPFDIDELEARIHAVMRRGAATVEVSNTGLGGLKLDAAAGVCYADGEALELSSREIALLGAVMERPGHAVTREKLWQTVFADGREAQPDAIEVVAYRLRKKIAPYGVELVALRGVGYLLREKKAD